MTGNVFADHMVPIRIEDSRLHSVHTRRCIGAAALKKRVRLRISCPTLNRKRVMLRIAADYEKLAEHAERKADKQSRVAQRD